MYRQHALETLAKVNRKFVSELGHFTSGLTWRKWFFPNVGRHAIAFMPARGDVGQPHEGTNMMSKLHGASGIPK